MGVVNFEVISGCDAPPNVRVYPFRLKCMWGGVVNFEVISGFGAPPTVRVYPFPTPIGWMDLKFHPGPFDMYIGRLSILRPIPALVPPPRRHFNMRLPAPKHFHRVE